MRETFLSFRMALMFCLVLSVAFINPAIAAQIDEDDDTSEDGTAYSYVKGWRSEVPLRYYKEHHYGSITEGNVYRWAFTRFRAWYGGELVYDSDKLWLDTYDYEEETYYEYANAAQTTTDSGYSDTIPPSTADIIIVCGAG